MLMIVLLGKCVFFYYWYYIIEEVILILQGEVEYCYGDQVYLVWVGDVIVVLVGVEVQVYQFINIGQEELCYVCFFIMQKIDVVEYFDSNKVGVIIWGDESGQGDGVFFCYCVYVQEVDYWEGEE